MMTQLRGCDISAYQPDVDFEALKAAGISFVVIKATEGAGYVNPFFARHWAGAKAAGLRRGAYGFVRWDSTTPEADAAHLVATVTDLEPGDVLAGDVEEIDGATPPADLSPHTSRWLRAVETAVKFRPFLYSNYAFILEHLSASVLGSYPLWMAAYGAPMPAPPKPWSLVSIWQHTATATDPGIRGYVDEDVFFGSLAQFYKLGKPAPAPPFTADWLLVTAQDRRVAPRVQEPKLPLIPANTPLQQLPYPTTSVAYNSAHWIYAKTEAGLTSWIDKANCKPL